MESQSAIRPLTPFSPGSVRELWHISFPLMLSALSGTLMFFLDRLILSHYSTEAMNAVATAGMSFYVFQFAAVGIAIIAEVFVGQFNGAKQYDRLGEPVWQMLWFSLGTCIIFWPVGELFSAAFIPDRYLEDGTPYFQWLMRFGPFFPMVPALSSFFIGQGKVRVVTLTILFGNIINLVLDLLFVFGLNGFIPSMGAKGAALATALAQVFQVAILFFLFNQKKNRIRYGTINAKFQLKLFSQCLRIGLPNALGHIFEISVWAIIAHMMANFGDSYITIYAVGQSVYVLLLFVLEGLEKGVAAIAANYIGAKQWQMIKPLLKSSFKLLGIMVAFVAIPLLILPDLFSSLFLAKATHIQGTSPLNQLAREVFFWMWLYFIFDGVVWIISGLLSAATDTKVMMYINVFSVVTFALMPTILLLTYFDCSEVIGWKVGSVYVMLNASLFYLRYKSQAWKKKALISDTLNAT